MTFALLATWLAGSPGLHAATLSTPSPTVPPRHLSDEENRKLPGVLYPHAEARSHANAIYAEAMLEGSTNDPRRTLDLMRQVAALDPHFDSAQVKIANLLLQLGRTEEALHQLQTASVTNPGSVPIQAALGFVQHLRGQTAEAQRLCTQALSRDPTMVVCLRVLLECGGEQNDLTGGLDRIMATLKATPVRVPTTTWLSLARLYLELARSDPHRRDGASILRTLLPVYQAAAAVDPPDVEALTLLANTNRDLGRRREALRNLRQAVLIEPDNAELVMRCGDLEAGLGLKAEALRDYETAYALNPAQPGLRELLGRFYLDDHRFDDAVRLLQEALADAPRDPGLLVDLGMAYDGLHQAEAAQDCFQRVFNAESCPPEAYLKLAAFQLSNKQLAKAVATLAIAQTRYPRSARVLFYQAVAARYAKNYAGALTALNAMRQVAPAGDQEVFDVGFYLENALNLNLAGRRKEVEAILREGLAAYPDNPDLMNELAYFWADDNRNLAEAGTLAKRSATLDPDSGATQDTLGWIEFKLGHFRDALPYLQRGAVLTNNDPVVLLHLGDDYQKLGRGGDALAAWRQALKKDPGNHDLIHRIDASPAPVKHAEPRSAPAP